MVRVEPELHKTLVIQARKNGKSLNAWVHDALYKVVKDGTPALKRDRDVLSAPLPEPYNFFESICGHPGLLQS
ncbi:MAG: toxin-antitoxin system HicB family antitoxin, partial [Desulfobacula sp.]|nr:toxin-antitoxin system HicB family antitoxin [Desulfobacula sp.]